MPDTIDIPLAIEQAGGSPELARDLFGMLLNDLPDLHQQVVQAHATGDAQALWDPVHKLHGATAYCGVPALREAARGVEDAIRQNAADLDSRLAVLEQAVRDLLAAGPEALAREW